MTITNSKPYTGEIKTLILKGSLSIGNKKDIDGNIWDVYDYIGGDYNKSGKAIIHARLIDNCAKYSTTTENNGWNIEYKLFYVEFIK